MTTGVWTRFAFARHSRTRAESTTSLSAERGRNVPSGGRDDVTVYHGSGQFRDFVRMFTKTYSWG